MRLPEHALMQSTHLISPGLGPTRFARIGPLLCPSPHSSGVSRAAPAAGTDYDLTIIAIGASPTPTHVAASYSRRVAPAPLRAALAGFAVRRGDLWRARSCRRRRSIVDRRRSAPRPSSPRRGSSPPARRCRWTRSSTPSRAGITRVLPSSWGVASASRAPPTAAPFTGCPVRLVATASGYEYDVERTPAGGAPSAAASPPAAPASPPARPRGAGLVALLAVLSLAALVAARLRARSPRRAK